MKRKLLAIMLVLAMVFSLAACGDTSKPKETKAATEAAKAATEAAKAATEAAKAATEAATEAANVVDDVKDAASEAADAVKDAVSDAADAAGDLVSEAAEAAGDLASEAVDAVEDLVSEAADLVEEAVSGAEELVEEVASGAEEAVEELVSEAATDAAEEAADNTEKQDIKIGVSIWSSTDVLGSKCKEIIDAAADALGVEVQYVDQGHVSEQVTASVETLCAAGCQGIIICNSADTEMTSAIKTCNDQGVYLAQFFRIISEKNSSDIYEMAKNSAYFVGAVHENEVENGEKLVQILIDKGCRNIGLIGWEQGDATWLGRWEGYQNGVKAWNDAHSDDQVTLSEPQYAGTTAEGGTKAAEALMAANPELDALIPAGGGGEPLLGAVAAVESAEKTGQIKIVSTDFLDDLGQRLEDGSMAGESGGHYCDPLFAFMMVYNAIKGNYTGFEGQFNEIMFPYLFVSSPEDYAGYEKYFVDQLPYTAEELKAMADQDLTALADTAAKLSIEDAAERSGN